MPPKKAAAPLTPKKVQSDEKTPELKVSEPVSNPSTGKRGRPKKGETTATTPKSSSTKSPAKKARTTVAKAAPVASNRPRRTPKPIDRGPFFSNKPK